MKNISVLTFIMLACAQQIFAQQWFPSYVPHGRNVVAVHIHNLTDIQMVGGNLVNDSIESIVRTDDAGFQWDIVRDHPMSSWLHSIDYADNNIGVAVGTNGKIVRTTDGGTTWVYLPSPVNSDFSKVLFLNEHRAIIVGGRDGDTTQTILQSNDAGETWTVLRQQYGSKLNAVAFTDSLHGVAVGKDGVILSTNDGGLSWSTVSSPTLRQLNEIDFADANTGIIVGGTEYVDAHKTILRTTDGGATWNLIKEEAGAWLNGVNFFSPDSGFAVGDSATFYSTTDGGLTWTSDSVPGATPYQDFNAVHFVSSDFGMVLSQGIVYIFCHAQQPVVHTLGATRGGAAGNGSFAGEVNTFGFPATYDFVYDTTLSFATPNAEFYPPAITTDTLSLVTHSFFNLPPNATYYYYLRVRNIGYTVIGDTLSVTNSTPSYSFEAGAAIPASDTSVVFYGAINNLPNPVTVHFEYGESPNLLHAFTTPDTTLSGGASYTVMASAGHLLPLKRYYFRMRGKAGGQLYVSTTNSFFLGTVADTVQTLAATNVTTTSATLNGIVAGAKLPLSLHFDYDTDPMQLNNTVIASPASLGDSLSHAVTAVLTALQPYTTYYYRLRLSTSIGEYFGDLRNFNSGTLFTDLQTKAASSVGQSWAQLNGFVHGLQVPATLSFEYGTTTALGSQAAAQPAAVSDSFYHDIKMNVTGLTAHTMYYYRIKLVAGSNTRYGDIRQFYTGASFVPNWDFQLWDTVVQEQPLGWILAGSSFTKVPGHTGSALKIGGAGYTIMGILGDSFIGGQAIGSRPDSLVAYLNYAVEPGDSGAAVLWMFKGDTPVVTDFYFFAGNTANTFQRVAFPIHYLSSLQPDSIALGFASFNPTGDEVTPHPNNYLIVDDVSFAPNTDAIFNGGFETWNTITAEMPRSWYGASFLFNDSAAYTLPLHRVLHSAPDDDAVELLSTLYNGHYLSTEITNWAKDFDAGGPSPITTRPQYLNGYCRFFPYPGDSAILDVRLLYQGQDIGFGTLLLADTIADFAPFDMPIIYHYNSNLLTPDSVVFNIKNSVKELPSRLALDKLNFDGFIGDLIIPDAAETMLPDAADVKVYPVPSSAYVIVEWTRATVENDFTVELYNVAGTIVQKTHSGKFEGRALLQVNSLPAGLYLVRLIGNDRTVSKKIIVTH